jgi:uncharacterized protein (TIGR02246 family)
MRRPAFLTVSALLILTTSCATAIASREPETIIALERAALDRWGKGDPQGFLETYAPDITYFDPGQQSRVDGIAAMREYLRPLTGRIKVDHYEMIGPRVQRHGDVAVLTYNLRSHSRRPDGEAVITRWNSTSVYARAGGRWRMIHSHWSFTAPERNEPRGP